ncbi:MAG: hypothetical protein ACI9MC_000351 [Kiritimatiellia bacterium]|jgi:hypothetical protein
MPTTSHIATRRFKTLVMAWCGALLCATGLILTVLDGGLSGSTTDIVLQIVLTIGLMASMIPAVGILLKRPASDPMADGTAPKQLAYGAPSLIQYEPPPPVQPAPTIQRQWGTVVPPERQPSESTVAPRRRGPPLGTARSSMVPAQRGNNRPSEHRARAIGRARPTPLTAPPRSVVSHLRGVGRVVPSATPVRRVAGPPEPATANRKKGLWGRV